MLTCKSTHTDQYLMFDSHHPLQHKLSVVRTLLSRNDEIVTNEEDRKTEEAHIRQALKACKYPDWAIDRVKKQLEDKKRGITRPKPDTNNSDKKKRGMVVLPYVQGVTERMQRVMRKHGIEAPARPHTTLRKLLVHPKDKIEDGKKCGLVYQVACLNCKQVYIGETGRKLETRIAEHRKEAEKVTNTIKTRSKSTSESTSEFKSAIAEHMRNNNHLMDWNNVKVLVRESVVSHRKVREACRVRMLASGVPMNRDDGGYELSHLWDPLLRSASKPPRRQAPATQGRPHPPRS